MTPIYLNNYKNLVEQRLMQVLQLGFQARTGASPVADTTALAALDVTAIADGDLCYVTTPGTVYQYSRYAAAGIAPAIVPAAYPGACWVAASIPATYGPNWRAPLLAQGSGALKAVVMPTNEELMIARETVRLLTVPTRAIPKHDATPILKK